MYYSYCCLIGLKKKSSKKALKEAVRFVHLPLTCKRKQNATGMFVIKELYELYNTSYMKLAEEVINWEGFYSVVY